MNRIVAPCGRGLLAGQRRCIHMQNAVLASVQTLKWDKSVALTEKGLRRQFHKLAQRLHPDVADGDANAMAEVNGAFALLADVARKAGGSVSVKHASAACENGGASAGSGEVVVQQVKKRFARCTTEEEVNGALEYLWDLASRGCLPQNDKIVAIALAQWALVLPLGVEHTRCIVSTCEQWLSNTGETPPLELLYDVLETYSDAFLKGEICGSVLSSCWPAMVEFVQVHSGGDEYVFSIVRRQMMMMQCVV